MQAVILAGGLATRMRPLTDCTPKSLLPVCGRAFIDYQLDLLQDGGVDDVVLCVGHLGAEVEAHVGDGKQRGIRIRYSYDGPTLKGTAGALKAVASLLDEAFFLTWGDSYVRVNHREMYSAHLAQDYARVTLGVFHNRGAYDRSNAEVCGDVVVRYAKGVADPAVDHIDAGISVFDIGALEDIPDDRHSDIDRLFAAYAASGRLKAFAVHQRFYEVGSPAGYTEFEQFVAARERVRA